MLRRLVFVGAFVLVGLMLLIAVVLPDLRIGFMSLAAAIVAGCWWVARRLPAHPMSILELRADAVMTSVLGVAFAMVVPSTLDCPVHPQPQGNLGQSPGGNCAVDHHIVLRLCIVLAAAGLSVALAAAARRRARASRPAFQEA